MNIQKKEKSERLFRTAKERRRGRNSWILVNKIKDQEQEICYERECVKKKEFVREKDSN